MRVQRRSLLLMLVFLLAVEAGCQHEKPDERVQDQAVEKNTAPKEVDGLLAWVDQAMPRARAGHTAMRLADGRVLVVGGFSGVRRGVHSTSADLFDPATNEWQKAASPSQARPNGQLTLLDDGRVLATGGRAPDGSFVASAEIYDPEKDAWANAASMPSGRSWHAATLLGDGRVLVTGGVGTVDKKDANGRASAAPLNSALVYDPGADRWQKAAPMPDARYNHATSLVGEQVLVAGGLTNLSVDEGGPINGVLLFDPAKGTWAKLASMKVARSKPQIAPLGDGRVLVAGRATASDAAEIYTVASDSWEEIQAPADAERLDRSQPLPEGMLLKLNRFDIAVFDPGEDGWVMLPRLDRGRHMASVTRLDAGRLLVAGGVGIEGSTIGRSERLARLPAEQVEVGPEPTTITLPAKGDANELAAAIWKQLDLQEERGCALFWGGPAHKLLADFSHPVRLESESFGLDAYLVCGDRKVNQAMEQLRFRQALAVGYSSKKGQFVAGHPSDMSYTQPLSKLKPTYRQTVLGMFSVHPTQKIPLEHLLSAMSRAEPIFTVSMLPLAAPKAE